MSILEMIGGTPLIELVNIAGGANGAVGSDGPSGTGSPVGSDGPVGAGSVRIFAKAEFFNPSGSVKDRAAKAMILDGIRRGALTKDKTIIDATSGNTGIAYSMIGAALGYKVKLYIPSNCSQERKRQISVYGAEIVYTDPLEGSDCAFIAAKTAAEKEPDKYFYPNQYDNTVNARAHYETTGVEIYEQTNGGVTHFITGMGTSGTFMGTSRRLKEYSSDIRCVTVQPSSPFHGIEGTKHMASTILPGIYDPKNIDDTISVTTEDAYAMARRLARTEGLFVGISSGANVAAAIALAKTVPKGSVIVTVLCDSGTRYFSDPFWTDSKVEEGAGI